MDKTERARLQEDFQQARANSSANAVAFVDDQLKHYFFGMSFAQKRGTDYEDLWQEVLFKAWKAIAKGTPITDVVGFVSRIWKFTMIDEARRVRPLPIKWLSGEDELPEKKHDPILTREAREALERLPVSDKGILALRIFLNWPWSDIANLLGMSASTVRANAFAALAELRHQLDNHKGR